MGAGWRNRYVRILTLAAAAGLISWAVAGFRWGLFIAVTYAASATLAAAAAAGRALEQVDRLVATPACRHVRLVAAGPQPIQVAKVLRDAYVTDLHQARSWLADTPVTLEPAIPAEAAEDLVNRLARHGAMAELEPTRP